jgi:hypothetical protein
MTTIRGINMTRNDTAAILEAIMDDMQALIKAAMDGLQIQASTAPHSDCVRWRTRSSATYTTVWTQTP